MYHKTHTSNKNSHFSLSFKQKKMKKNHFLSGLLAVNSLFLPSLLNAKVINGDDEDEFLRGSKNDDVINGNGGDDIIIARGGDDTINAGEGNDYVNGGSGNDTVDGGAGNDLIKGGSGNDALSGGSGMDILIGGRGNDILNGGADYDFLYGGRGNDIIEGGSGGDYLHGGRGNDTLSYAGSSAGIKINLATRTASGGDAEGDTFRSFENITGSAFNDILTGNKAANIINGGDGFDVIDGGRGADVINGGDGRDIIIIREADNSAAEDTIDAGEDADYLRFIGAGNGTPFAVDVGELNAINYERIDLDNNTAVELTIDAEDFTDINPNYGSISIRGSQEDSVIMNSDWDQGGYMLRDETVHYTFHHFNEETGESARLHVSMEIGTITGIELRDPTYEEVSPNNFVAPETEFSTAFGASLSEEDLTVTAGNKFTYIATGSGNDVIDVSASEKGIISTGDGDDTVIGGVGREYIYGSKGADSYDGGEGFDTVSFFNSHEAININLETGVYTGAYVEGDSYTSIEKFTGSKTGDVFIGDDGDNAFGGNNGNDYIDGRGGNDVLHGDEDADILIGGTGDDTLNLLELYDYKVDTYDGGADTDILDVYADRSKSNAFEVDLSLVNMVNMEIVRLNGRDLDEDRTVDVSLTLDDLISVTDEDNHLIFQGENSLSSVSSTGQGWVQEADQDIDGETYNVYSIGDATLLIDADLQQDIS